MPTPFTLVQGNVIIEVSRRLAGAARARAGAVPARPRRGVPRAERAFPQLRIACIARGDESFVLPDITSGTYYFVVDTFVSQSGSSKPGAAVFSIIFEPGF